MSPAPCTIKPVDASCADAVAEVFRSIYGDTYPVEYVYRGAGVMEEIAAGRLNSALAFDAQGTPAGYVAIYTSAPNPRLWEGGNLLVVPGRGNGELAWSLLQHYLSPEHLPPTGSDGIFGESVCHHFFTQMACAKSGFADCALALEQMDGAAFHEHAPESERVACLLQFFEQSDPGGECHLPEQYAEPLRGILGRLRPRNLRRARAPLPATGNTVRHDSWFAGAGMWRISVSSVGDDWSRFLDELPLQAGRRGVVSLQVVISTALPHISEAVEELRRRGFFLGGLFPRWFGADGVMMQRVFGREPDYEGIRLYGAAARALLEFIRHDRQSLPAQGGAL